MLKHATPRSSPSLGSNSSTSSRLGGKTPEDVALKYPSTNGDNLQREKTSDPPLVEGYSHAQDHPQAPFNERGVDCEGIVTAEPLQKKLVSTGGFSSLFADKFLGLGNFGVSGSGIGPVITHGRAIVRRGLSFNSKKEADSQSLRSVKSEGKDTEKGTNKLQNSSQSANLIQCQTNGLENEETPCGFNKNVGLLPSPKKDTNPPPISKEGFNSKLLKTTSNTSNTKESPKSSKSSSPESKVDHPTLKSLLRLPGVYGHIPVPENAPSSSPHIVSPDSLSLNSSNSFRSSNSGRTSSRSWGSNASSTSNNTTNSSQSNCSSSSEPAAQTTLKVYAKCLRSDIEYKTLSLDPKTTCRELIDLLLSKVRMRHRDPNLFYLTMEVFVRKWSGLPVRALLVLEENARPAQLAMCRPPGDIRFALQMRRGGVVKIHDTVLMPGSQYKSLLISYRTTAEEVVQLLLNCYSRKESKHYYALHEVCRYPEYSDRRLGYIERPLELKAEWPKDRKAEYVFVLRRNMTQALSLRKLFIKTSEVLKEKEEILSRKLMREQILHQNKIINENNKNRLIRVEAEPGIVIPEEATVIDCTTVTPTMSTFRSTPTALLVNTTTHLDNRNNKILSEKPKNTGTEPVILKLHPKSSPKSSDSGVSGMNGATESVPSKPRQNNSSSSNKPKRVHFEHDIMEPNKSESSKPKLPQNSLPERKNNTDNLTTFLGPKEISSGNNLKFSIGAQTELTLISVNGFRRNVHKWNSVETLVEISENMRPKPPLNKTQLEHRSKNVELEKIKEKLKQNHICQHNCEKCFYI